MESKLLHISISGSPYTSKYEMAGMSDLYECFKLPYFHCKWICNEGQLWSFIYQLAVIELFHFDFEMITRGTN